MKNYTIIIPHYNIPELLLRCINSIPKREDIQIIVVDDCSPCQDKVFTTLNSLQNKNLEWYSTPIGGSAGRARNVGLKHAKGKWLIFMDADDLFSTEASDIFNCSINRTEDILFYNIKAVMNDNLEIESKRNFYYDYFNHLDDEDYDAKFRYHFHSLWGKIFNRDFINKHNILFDNTRYSNDVCFSYLAGLHADCIYKSKKVLYIVTERNDSLASSLMKDSVMSKNECKTRLMVALKVYDLNKKAKTGVIVYGFFNYLDMLREHYKLCYAYTVLQLLFTYPHLGIHQIKKTLKLV